MTPNGGHRGHSSPMAGRLLRSRRWRVTVAAMLVFAVASCDDPSNAESAETTSPAESAANDDTTTTEFVVNTEETELVMQNSSFRPEELTVLTGTTVIWTNEDSTPHTVTSDDEVWDSGEVASGESFRFTFDETGTYRYHCEIHPGMEGVIEVVDE